MESRWHLGKREQKYTVITLHDGRVEEFNLIPAKDVCRFLNSYYPHFKGGPYDETEIAWAIEQGIIEVQSDMVSIAHMLTFVDTTCDMAGWKDFVSHPEFTKVYSDFNDSTFVKQKQQYCRLKRRPEFSFIRQPFKTPMTNQNSWAFAIQNYTHQRKKNWINNFRNNEKSP